jgi:hypothetical protein
MFAVSLDSPDVSTLGAAALFIFAAVVAWRTWANRSSSSTEGSGLIAKVEGVAEGLVAEIDKLRGASRPDEPQPEADQLADGIAALRRLDAIWRDRGVEQAQRNARFLAGVADILPTAETPPPKVPS